MPDNPFAQYKKPNPFAVYKTAPQPKPLTPPSGFAPAGQVAPVTALPGGPQDPRVIAQQEAARVGAAQAIQNSYEMRQIQAREAAQAAVQARNNQLPLGPKDKTDLATKLRNELDGLEAVRRYKASMPSYASALTSPDSAAGDLDMIYAYAKIMDPTSSVREGESENVQNLGTLGQQIYGNLRKQFNDAGKLPPDLRKQLRVTLANRVADYDRAYNFERARYRDLAKKQGISPDLVVGPHLGDAYAAIENKYFRGDPNKSAAAARAEQAAGGGNGGSGGPMILPGAAPATGATKSVTMSPENAKLISTLIQQGYNADQINKILVPMGVIGPSGYSQDIIDKARETLARGGSIAPAYEQPTSIIDRAINSPAGTFVGSAIDADMGGFSDEIAGMLSPNMSIDEANAAKQANAAANRKSAIAGQMLGNIGGMALGGAALKGTALVGSLGKAAPYIGATGFGALEGAGQNNDNRVLGGGLGALAAGAAFPIGEVASIPVNAALRTKPGMAFSQGVRNVGARVPGINRLIDQSAPTYAPGLSSAENMAAGIFDKAGPDAIKAQLDEAASLGVPMSLADTSKRATLKTADNVRRSPDAATFAESVLPPRSRGQIDRLQAALARDLGPIENIPELSKNLGKKASADAGPLFDKAFEGGSIAPLEHQFQAAFSDSSAAVAKAQRALADARNQATQAAAGVSRAGDNVYSSSAALRGNRSAGDAVAKAEQDLAAAQATHQANLERLRQAQADGSANAPGAVWSPRIQQFLDDPITQSGLARGVEVQRLEALAEGKPFNPTELAITGTDQAGNPIVASVPNMRTLHTVKRGFDEILNDYPRTPGGDLILDQRGRAVDQVRKAFLSHVDTLNPDYPVARAAWGGPMASRDALERGKSLFGQTPNTVGVAVEGQSPEQLAQMQLGFRSQMMDRANTVRDSANPWEATLGSTANRQRIDAMYPGNPGNANLFRQRELEEQLAKSQNRILGGSTTDENAIGSKRLLSPGLDAAVDIGSTVMTGGYPVAPMAKVGYSGLKNALKLGAEKRAVQRADEFVPLMLNTDPSAAASTVDDIMAKLAARRAFEARQNITRPSRMFAAGGALAAQNGYWPF